jgi:hypothetical protein
MLGGPENYQFNPDQDTRVEEGKEIKWVYTASLPHEEGRENVQLVLGVPQDSEWLQPDMDRPSVHHYTLPLNLIAGGEGAKLAITGAVKADSSDNVNVRLAHMTLARSSLDTSSAWKQNLDRIRDHLDTLEEAVIEQCRIYLISHADPAVGRGE